MILVLFSLFAVSLPAQSIPRPDHVVILMLENNGWGDIVGSANAPYLNTLVNDPANATFSQSYALIHPSQPNYIMLFSGASQGVTNNNNITNAPFSAPNLGASLLSAGYSFKGYSEDLPSAGSLVYYYGGYARKHAPWTNWQGGGTNQLPASTNQPWTSFPSNGAYNTLPTLSFIVPNLSHDMHDPLSNPDQAVANGDAWVQSNLANYISWAKTHNSLLIITFDEDRGSMVNGVSNTSNRITTLFIGEKVKGGTYSQRIDHYNVLRTLEDMYGLPYAGNSATASPIDYCWKTNTTGIGAGSAVAPGRLAIFPNPAVDKINITIPSAIYNTVNLTVFDITGRLVKDEKIELAPGLNEAKVDPVNFSSGVYIFRLSGPGIDLTEKIVVEK